MLVAYFPTGRIQFANLSVKYSKAEQERVLLVSGQGTNFTLTNVSDLLFLCSWLELVCRLLAGSSHLPTQLGVLQ